MNTDTTTPSDRRPMAFLLAPYHELERRSFGIVAPKTMADMVRVCGTVPATLESEEAVLAFANSVGIRLLDADIEDAVAEYHGKRVPTRGWLKAEFARFHAWLIEHNWLEPPVAAAVPAERPRRRARTGSHGPESQADDPVPVGHPA